MTRNGSRECEGRRGGDRGFALVLVIWVLALLAVLAASVAADSRSEAVITRNRLETAQARAIADAGVTLALAGLIDPDPAARWPADGGRRRLRYGGGTIEVTVQDEGGKINLNKAPAEFIGSLLAELGAGAAEQAAVTNGILDRRRAFARAAGPLPSRFFFQSGTYDFDAAKQPFATVSELRLVAGLSDRLYQAIRPFVTVYSESATVNPLTAPRTVLLSIPGVSPQEVGFFLAARRTAAHGTGVGAPRLSGAGRYARIAEVHAVTIISRATVPGGASFTREAVAGLSPEVPLQPFKILSWRQFLGSRNGGEAASPR